MTTLFGRHQAPVIPVDSLKKNESLLLIYGVIPNRRGQTVVRRWFGLRFKKEAFTEELTFNQVMETTGFTNPRIPNSGKPDENCRGAKLLSGAAQKAEEVMARERSRFNEYADPILREQYKKLREAEKNIYSQLELRFNQRKDRESLLARGWIDREKEQVKNETIRYQEWIENHMITEEKAA